MSEFQDRAAIVTGSGSGIGRAIAIALAEKGCDVAVFDVDAEGVEATAEMVTRLGVRCLAVTGSVAVRTDVAAFAANVLSEFGKVDFLINNAGVLRSSAFLDTSYDDWRATFDVNVDGTYNFCQEILPRMIARKEGVVVNMASWTGKKGVPNLSSYSASKAALINLTQALAAEMGVHGIRVNAVCPGIINDTKLRDAAEKLYRERNMPDEATRVRNSVPLQRVGIPSDVASLVTFLCSSGASYMTGQALNVTGGLWMN
ncbi:MAG: SDR family oxidoreductase [Rhodobiaceae bacterium]|nr:SDR family oxidoreductase [Rhodobiaceae bacterium]MCC0056187.1 SDR family oxidoreductase [Rhodobiaceae bacterium]